MGAEAGTSAATAQAPVADGAGKLWLYIGDPLQPAHHGAGRYTSKADVRAMDFRGGGKGDHRALLVQHEYRPGSYAFNRARDAAAAARSLAVRDVHMWEVIAGPCHGYADLEWDAGGDPAATPDFAAREEGRVALALELLLAALAAHGVAPHVRHFLLTRTPPRRTEDTTKYPSGFKCSVHVVAVLDHPIASSRALKDVGFPQTLRGLAEADAKYAPLFHDTRRRDPRTGAVLREFAFDTAVYSKDRAMRMLGQSKAGKSARFERWAPPITVSADGFQVSVASSTDAADYLIGWYDAPPAVPLLAAVEGHAAATERGGAGLTAALLAQERAGGAWRAAVAPLAAARADVVTGEALEALKARVVPEDVLAYWQRVASLLSPVQRISAYPACTYVIWALRAVAYTDAMLEFVDGVMRGANLQPPVAAADVRYGGRQWVRSVWDAPYRVNGVPPTALETWARKDSPAAFAALVRPASLADAAPVAAALPRGEMADPRAGEELHDDIFADVAQLVPMLSVLRLNGVYDRAAVTRFRSLLPVVWCLKNMEDSERMRALLDAAVLRAGVTPAQRAAAAELWAGMRRGHGWHYPCLDRWAKKDSPEMHAAHRLRSPRAFYTAEITGYALPPGRQVYRNHVDVNGFLKPLPDTAEDLVVVAPLGRGKSFQIRRVIERMLRDAEAAGARPPRVLYVSGRRSYTESSMQEFARFGFEDYAELTKRGAALIGVNRLFVQVESLWRLLSPARHGQLAELLHGKPDVVDGWAHAGPFDLVVLDESETLLMQLTPGPTHHRRHALNVAAMQYVVRTGGRVVAMDAYVTGRTLQFMTALRSGRGRDLAFVECDVTPTPLTARRVRRWNAKTGAVALKAEFDTTVALLVEDVKAGKRPYVVFSSKADFYAVQRVLEEELPLRVFERGLFFCGDDSEAHRREYLADINTTWARAPFVCTTSAITVGINYDPKRADGAPDSAKWFDCLYVFASPYGPTIRDLFQATLRPRHYRDAVVTYCLKTSAPPQFAVGAAAIRTMLDHEDGRYAQLLLEHRAAAPHALESWHAAAGMLLVVDGDEDEVQLPSTLPPAALPSAKRAGGSLSSSVGHQLADAAASLAAQERVTLAALQEEGADDVDAAVVAVAAQEDAAFDCAVSATSLATSSAAMSASTPAPTRCNGHEAPEDYEPPGSPAPDLEHALDAPPDVPTAAGWPQRGRPVAATTEQVARDANAILLPAWMRELTAFNLNERAVCMSEFEAVWAAYMRQTGWTPTTEADWDDVEPIDVAAATKVAYVDVRDITAAEAARFEEALRPGSSGLTAAEKLQLLKHKMQVMFRLDRAVTAALEASFDATAPPVAPPAMPPAEDLEDLWQMWQRRSGGTFTNASRVFAVEAQLRSSVSQQLRGEMRTYCRSIGSRYDRHLRSLHLHAVLPLFAALLAAPAERQPDGVERAIPTAHAAVAVLDAPLNDWWTTQTPVIEVPAANKRKKQRTAADDGGGSGSDEESVAAAEEDEDADSDGADAEEDDSDAPPRRGRRVYVELKRWTVCQWLELAPRIAALVDEAFSVFKLVDVGTEALMSRKAVQLVYEEWYRLTRAEAAEATAAVAAMQPLDAVVAEQRRRQLEVAPTVPPPAVGEPPDVAVDVDGTAPAADEEAAAEEGNEVVLPAVSRRGGRGGGGGRRPAVRRPAAPRARAPRVKAALARLPDLQEGKVVNAAVVAAMKTWSRLRAVMEAWSGDSVAIQPHQNAGKPVKARYTAEMALPDEALGANARWTRHFVVLRGNYLLWRHLSLGRCAACGQEARADELGAGRDGAEIGGSGAAPASCEACCFHRRKAALTSPAHAASPTLSE